VVASVIVPARDAAGTLPKTLDALARQRVDVEYEVIVVDDGSSDETGALAARAGCRVVAVERAVGPGAARNRGASAARGELLAFTDADCVPSGDWLAAGLRAIEQADIVQGRVEPDPGVELWPFDRTLWVREAGGLFQSANLFVRRETFQTLGGFRDGLMPLAGSHFGEDVDFGWRAQRAGARVAFSPEVLVHHAVLRRSALDFVRERRRDALFPELVRHTPELRGAFLYRRWFLSGRSARFVLAVSALLLAGGPRSRKVALVAALPYCSMLVEDTRTFGPRTGFVRAAADAVSLLSLVQGSVRARTLVL